MGEDADGAHLLHQATLEVVGVVGRAARVLHPREPALAGVAAGDRVVGISDVQGRGRIAGRGQPTRVVVGVGCRDVAPATVLTSPVRLFLNNAPTERFGYILRTGRLFLYQ